MTDQEDDSSRRQLMDLVGEPALLKREDVTLFRRLKREIENQIKPQNILDDMRVMDIANGIWESQRFRRHLVGLVDGERVRAVQHLILPFVGLDHEQARNLAKNYCSSDRKKQASAAQIVGGYGITDDQIEARAVVSNGRSFDALNRGIAARDTMRRTILKEIAREQRRAEKLQRKSKKSKTNGHARSEPKPTLPAKAS